MYVLINYQIHNTWRILCIQTQVCFCPTIVLIIKMDLNLNGLARQVGNSVLNNQDDRLCKMYTMQFVNKRSQQTQCTFFCFLVRVKNPHLATMNFIHRTKAINFFIKFLRELMLYSVDLAKIAPANAKKEVHIHIFVRCSIRSPNFHRWMEQLVQFDMTGSHVGKWMFRPRETSSDL